MVDAEAQVDLGWFIGRSLNFLILIKALNIRLATQSDEPLMQAYAYNNIGVTYSYHRPKQIRSGNADAISEENF